MDKEAVNNLIINGLKSKGIFIGSIAPEVLEAFSKMMYKAINYTHCCTELPNIYEKEFNSERIKIINTLSDNYNVDKSTVRSLFCDGADWYKQKLTK